MLDTGDDTSFDLAGRAHLEPLSNGSRSGAVRPLCWHDAPVADREASAKSPKYNRAMTQGGIAPAAGKAAGTSMATIDVTVTMHIWYHWARVAIEQLSAAHKARQECLAAQGGSKPNEASEAVPREFIASALATTTSAFAVDAFYGAAKDVAQVPQATRDKWKADPPARHRQILETLKAGSKLGAQTQPLGEEIKLLFKKRGALVHPPEQTTAGAPHPAMPAGGHFAIEYTQYTLEVAERSVKAMLDVFTTCIANPKAHIEKWANDRKGLVQALEQYQSSC